MGDDGLIQKAEQASQMQANAEAADSEAMDELDKYLGQTLGELGPNGKVLVTKVTSTEHTGISAEDKLGNLVYIPGGFKVASDSGKTVQEGIVIEDDDGNQFVWVPVSNISHDGSNKIKIENEDGTTSEVEITLGRYTFDTTTGAETKVQYASKYAATTLEAVTAGTVTSYRAGSFFYELTDFRESNQVSSTTGTNATAKDLAGFIESVEEKQGYYLARYEASYSSGSIFGVGDDETYYKPASKVSTVATQDSWTPYTSEDFSTEGYLWNFITQGNASIACRQMYYGNNYVESDLVNSYAWDTAIVYIQAMGNENYANQKDENGTLYNAGDTTINDQKCKIFNMASNCAEWTTEYYMYSGGGSGSSSPKPICTVRGGCYSGSNFYTSVRNGTYATDSYPLYGFRPLLYCKTGA